jgi:hypothetical protein
LRLESPLPTHRVEDSAGSGYRTYLQGTQGSRGGSYIVGESLTSANQLRINSFALAARLPSLNPNRERLETGGLVSYGPNFPSLYRRAGDFVDKILRGAKPADIPVEQPTKFDFVINLITAEAIGPYSSSRGIVTATTIWKAQGHGHTSAETAWLRVSKCPCRNSTSRGCRRIASAFSLASLTASSNINFLI